MKNFIYKFSILGITSFFIGCGGGSGSPSNSNNFTGQFIDAPVEGLQYLCSSGKSGITNAKGEFTCKNGDNVSFSIGELDIGTISVDKIITPYNLFPNNIDAAVNLARLLQTVDENNGSENKIKLNKEKISKLPKNINFESKQFVSNIEASLNESLISKEEAMQHMDSSIAEQGIKIDSIKSYHFDSNIDINELRNNTKKALKFIKKEIKYLSDEDNLKNIYNCANSEYTEACSEYMMHLNNKALYSFLKVSDNKHDLESLKSINVGGILGFFQTNAYAGYIELRTKLTSFLPKLYNFGLTNLSYQEMVNYQGVDFSKKLHQSDYAPSQGSYYFAMIAYHLANIGRDNIDTFFTKVKNKVENNQYTNEQKKEIYTTLAQMSKDMRPFILANSPKISNNKEELKKLINTITNETSVFVQNYFKSQWKGDTYGAYSEVAKTLLHDTALSYYLVGLEVYENLDTAKDLMHLVIDSFNESSHFLEKQTELLKIQNCNSPCGGSLHKNWRFMNNTFYIANEVYTDIRSLETWEKKFKTLASNNGNIKTYSWFTSPWGECNNSTKTRTVNCKDNNNSIVNDNLCPNNKPSVSTSCNSQNITYSWITSEWSSCEGKCGTNNATKTRSVYCQSSYNATVSPSNCTEPKPTTSQSCTKEQCLDNTTITHKGYTYKIITSPITGKQWLDRNLGATKVCTKSRDDSSFSSDDEYVQNQKDCFGDYYQWGRLADGHEKSNSNTTSTLVNTNEKISNVGHNNFITLRSIGDWVLKGLDDNGGKRATNWNKSDGSGICPNGFKVPSITELRKETIDFVGTQNLNTGAVKVTNRDTAFKNFLRLPASGYRYRIVGGSLGDQGGNGVVWSSSVDGVNSLYVYFNSRYAVQGSYNRAYGRSVRCVKH